MHPKFELHRSVDVGALPCHKKNLGPPQNGSPPPQPPVFIFGTPGTYISMQVGTYGPFWNCWSPMGPHISKYMDPPCNRLRWDSTTRQTDNNDRIIIIILEENRLQSLNELNVFSNIDSHILRQHLQQLFGYHCFHHLTDYSQSQQLTSIPLQNVIT